MTAIAQSYSSPLDRAYYQLWNDLNDVNWNEVCQKVKRVAVVALQVFTAIVLCWTNPTLFFLGGIVGIIKDDMMGEMVDKMTTVWQENTGIVTFGLGFSAFIALPVTLAFGAFLVGGNIGKHLSVEAQKKKGTYHEIHEGEVKIIARGDKPINITVNVDENVQTTEVDVEN